MKEQLHIYTIEIEAAPYIWHSMNIHAQLFAEGKIIKVENDKSADTCSLSVSTDMAVSETTLCLYVVPHTLPSSGHVSDSPLSDLTVKAYKDGKLLDSKEYDVNRWAGLQLIGLRYQ